MSQVEWMQDALCAQVDNDLFFPQTGQNSSTALSICKKCDVKIECLNYALSFEIITGIWGGTTERQRRQIKRLAA